MNLYKFPKLKKLENYTKVGIIALLMERFEDIEKLLIRDLYTKQQIFDLIERYYPHYDLTSNQWILGLLVQRNVLTNLGFDCYKRNGNSLQLNLYNEDPSSPLATAIDCVLKGNEFVCFSTSILNELFNAPAALDLTILEVKKDLLYPIFLDLKAKTKIPILLNPNDDELFRYYSEGALLLRPYASKAPLGDGAYRIEKLIVDLMKDRLIASIFVTIDVDECLSKLFKEYDFNIKTMLAYAERKGVKKQALEYLYKYLPKEKIEILLSTYKFPKLKEVL